MNAEDLQLLVARARDGEAAPNPPPPDLLDRARSDARRRRRTVTLSAALGAAAVILAIVVIPGWRGPDRDPGPSTSPPELVTPKFDGCSDILTEKSGRQGTRTTGPPAADTPPLPSPDRAWICQYSLERNPDDQKDEWVLRDAPVEVTGQELSALKSWTADLRLERASGGGTCTADLGPMWLLVVEEGATRAGLTYADFGCRTVALTEDGTSEGYSVVPGSLAAVGGLTVLCELFHNTEGHCR